MDLLCHPSPEEGGDATKPFVLAGAGWHLDCSLLNRAGQTTQPRPLPLDYDGTEAPLHIIAAHPIIALVPALLMPLMLFANS